MTPAGRIIWIALPSPLRAEIPAPIAARKRLAADVAVASTALPQTALPIKE
jgi:hypothetical protein